MAQLLFTLTSGGASLADAERLGQDRMLMQILGLERSADQTTLGQWLRDQTKESVLALHLDQRRFGGLGQPAGQAGTVAAGRLCGVVFDDTEIEVKGHQFEGARINY